MTQRQIGNIVLENAQIRFRNFAGEESKFNAKGNRNFCVLLDDELAEALTNDGWNIKYLKPRDPEDSPRPYLQVKVSYDHIPPKIWLVTRHNKQLLDETTVNILDWAEIANVDVVIRPYTWEVNGKTGVKAYVKSMYVTIAEDDFDGKYDDLPAATDAPEDDDVPF